ncbi:ornithine carbamoyl transferase precursor [Phyllosticta paracitricarpa]|uniref:Ornithine carbamoyltransferase, mitochondrial n=1 Tax=Phyllosticta paracitricarpa TaxID=2016321 RepID=A0ABR1MYP5_9PEZI
MPPLRLCTPALRTLTRAPAARRGYHSANAPTKPPRHLLSIADLTPEELTTLVRNALSYKRSIKGGSVPNSIRGALDGKTIAMTFSKRSTRTRISTEGAVVKMGGHPMFLGKEDIQLGVNESLYDTAVVMSSMVAGIFARVGPHSDVATLAKHSSVPVINALSDLYHPLQTIADFVTISENFLYAPHSDSLDSAGLKLAWIGDANNVLFDLAIGAAKLGVDLAVATPKGYEIPSSIRDQIAEAAAGPGSGGGRLIETTSPSEAVAGANVLVTDTWVSMGQEAEAQKKMADFAGFQITEAMGREGGAKDNWKFMHCLPRHAEEVADEVFYGPRSLVFPEAENRLWAAISAIQAFIVNQGDIQVPLEISKHMIGHVEGQLPDTRRGQAMKRNMSKPPSRFSPKRELALQTEERAQEWFFNESKSRWS